MRERSNGCYRKGFHDVAIEQAVLMVAAENRAKGGLRAFVGKLSLIPCGAINRNRYGGARRPAANWRTGEE